MKFGVYIRSLREKLGWTQPEAAEKIEIEQSYLSKLETGKCFPSEDIFSRLSYVYRIDAQKMSEIIDSNELEKLKEVSEVRKVVLNNQNVQVRSLRRWLVLGLVSLMLGGAFIGASLVEINERQYYYRSMGVLLKGESLDAFDIVKETLGYTTTEGIAEKKFLERQLMMTNRIAQIDIVLPTSRGAGYIEEVTDGKRYFKTFLDHEVQHHNRWFIVPGLMFLLGSFGCFLIGFRWK